MPPVCMPTKERPVQVVWGDCLRVMNTLPPGCVDTVITDPPYGLHFMGKEWDHGVPGVPFWESCLRVAKPGAFLLAFGGTRTWHRLACAIEDAGWEIRDTLCWLYGTGFPKAKSCLKPAWEPIILALKPAERAPPLNIDQTRIPTNGPTAHPPVSTNKHEGWKRPWHNDEQLRAACAARQEEAHKKRDAVGRWPANVVLDEEAARMLDEQTTHLHTSVKPVQRTPLLNIDAARIQTTDNLNGGAYATQCTSRDDGWGMQRGGAGEYHQPSGRWPANVVLACCGNDPHDAECPIRLLDEQAGPLRARGNKTPTKRRESNGIWSAHGSSFGVGPDGPVDPGDSGGPSRFFYCSKASKAERGEGNNHATVKPLALMRWLVKLVSFPGDLILDPFAGSGTTGLAAAQEGRRCLLVEKEQPSVKITRSRLASMAPEVTSNGADSGR